MELVNVSQLKPGQILASAVTNPMGVMLCPAGFRLTEAAIGRLVNAGIESVVVEGTNRRAQDIDSRMEQLQNRFEGIDDPVLLQLKATIENRFQAMRLE